MVVVVVFVVDDNVRGSGVADVVVVFGPTCTMVKGCHSNDDAALQFNKTNWNKETHIDKALLTVLELHFCTSCLIFMKATFVSVLTAQQ